MGCPLTSAFWAYKRCNAAQRLRPFSRNSCRTFYCIGSWVWRPLCRLGRAFIYPRSRQQSRKWRHGNARHTLVRCGLRVLRMFTAEEDIFKRLRQVRHWWALQQQCSHSGWQIFWRQSSPLLRLDTNSPSCGWAPSAPSASSGYQRATTPIGVMTAREWAIHSAVHQTLQDRRGLGLPNLDIVNVENKAKALEEICTHCISSCCRNNRDHKCPQCHARLDTDVYPSANVSDPPQSHLYRRSGQTLTSSLFIARSQEQQWVSIKYNMFLLQGALLACPSICVRHQ